MLIGVPKETAPGERRVALVPDSVARLVKSGREVQIERGAGVSAFHLDADYEAAGATLAADAAAVLGGSDIILKVQKPAPEEAAAIREGAALVSFLAPSSSGDLLAALAGRRVTAFSMELVPRITRAQSMDVLSSQATVAGYKAVLLGAGRCPRLLPMLTTAAGTLAPAKVFVIGAGVAGLQAIATARRLGAVVSAFDVRPAVREQVQSLGATFVAAEQVSARRGAGGYAKELAGRAAAAGARCDRAAHQGHGPGDHDGADPGPGGSASHHRRDGRSRCGRASVIVDLAAETGGNCALTRSARPSSRAT